jgi:hypothetical protein
MLPLSMVTLSEDGAAARVVVMELSAGMIIEAYPISTLNP